MNKKNMKFYFLSLVVFLTAVLSAEEKLHVHFISGSKEYQSEESLKAFGAYLENTYEVMVTASWVTDKATDLPEVDLIEKADVLLVFARRLNLPADQMAKVRRHWDAEKGVVGVRTASHAFSDRINEIFDGKIMGGNYEGHFVDGVVEVIATEGAATHPATKKVGLLKSRKLYKAGELSSGAVILQTGTMQLREGKTEAHPVTWVNQYGKKGRSFYTSLGVPTDFEDEKFLRMMVQAIYWAADREVPPFKGD